MVFTSVSGHLLNYEFVGSYKRWHGCSPLELFTAPVVKDVKEESMMKIRVSTETDINTLNFHFLRYRISQSKYDISQDLVFPVKCSDKSENLRETLILLMAACILYSEVNSVV